MPTREEAIDALRDVEDPELGMDIVELGLLYDVEVDGARVKAIHSLTSMGCPAGPMITWDPPWTPEKMSGDAKFILGIG